MSGSEEERAQALMERGFELLREGDLEAALEVSRELEELQNTAAFDIAAQAHAALGEPERAIAVLERGLDVAPDCWPNWQLLGNLRSDRSEFAEADEAYGRALACTDAWKASIRLNQAILATRRGEPAQALVLLDEVEDEELFLRAESARLHALELEGRGDEAVERAERVLSEEQAQDLEPQEFGVMGEIAATLGYLYLDRGEEHDDVRELALSWCSPSSPAPNLLALIRDLDADLSPAARRFRLLLHGEVAPEVVETDPDMGGFYVMVDVVADGVEEALGYVRRYFDETVAPVLEVESSQDHGPAAELLGGVYWQSALHAYTEDGHGDDG